MNTPSLNSLDCAQPGDTGTQSIFPAELPVSYDTAGNVASRFGDRFWNLSSFSTDGTSAKNLYFYVAESTDDFNLDSLRREQHKALMWLHMDAGKTRSWGSLLNSNLALHICCKTASFSGLNLYAMLTNSNLLAETVRTMNRGYAVGLSTSLRTLWRHRKELLAAPNEFPLDNLLSIIAAEIKNRPEDQQTPLIPSRVYCGILSALGDRMNVIESELDALLDAFTKCAVAKRDAPKVMSERKRYIHRSKALAEVSEEMKKLGHEPRSMIPLTSFIFQRLTAHKIELMLTLAAYTGMRVGEISILPLDDVLKEFEHMGSTHYEVCGATHKLNKGVKRSTTWITSDQGARAVRLAQRIARCIALNNIEPPKAGQQALLFSSNINVYKALGRTSFFDSTTEIRAKLCPVIQQSDIEELDRLELSRDWARDDIVVGARWPLAFHQLRRSLAVYAHRSGMVSLPALKAQLQHITQEMTSYYSDGFSRAVNLVFDKDHFSHEWNAAQAESSYFAYALGVLFSDEDLFGQGVKRMANTAESRNGQEILRLFEENKVAYRETPLGGCVSTDNCEIDPLEPIPYDCLETNCINLVVFGKRLDHVINHQEMAVATLARDEAGSVEHRLEANHLTVLLKARERLRKGA